MKMKVGKVLQEKGERFSTISNHPIRIEKSYKIDENTKIERELIFNAYQTFRKEKENAYDDKYILTLSNGLYKKNDKYYKIRDKLGNETKIEKCLPLITNNNYHKKSRNENHIITISNSVFESGKILKLNNKRVGHGRMKSMQINNKKGKFTKLQEMIFESNKLGNLYRQNILQQKIRRLNSYTVNAIK